MPNTRPFPASRPRNGRLTGAGLALGLILSVAAPAVAQGPGPSPVPGDDPFARFDLPDAWEERFWSDPGVQALGALDPKALADLVPVQAGVRHCRCPGCDSTEAEDPLVWSILKPDVLTCRRCGLTVPNEKVPAKKDDKVPEETVEVRPRVLHHYPYHEVEPEKQHIPDERLYLAAKRDYEAREFLSRAALYAAVRAHEQPIDPRSPALARLAAVLILRFAQVYPAYATHYDQPDQPKYFQQADLPPPYRRGYQTGKWDWTADLDVPMNLLIAYALVRGGPATAEAGRLLGDPDPSRTIERDLFRASAEFVRHQPEEFSEMSLHAYRGLLAVGRLLNDPLLVREAMARLQAFAERGFYHDGYWRQGDATAHRRVVGQIDGWIDRLLIGYVDAREAATAASAPAPGAGTPRDAWSQAVEVPMLALARGASSVLLADPRGPEVHQAAWPSPVAEAIPRHPALLGGAGLARLALGQGDDALDLELRGLDAHGGPHFQRQAIRLAVGGRPVLGDLDELPPTASGWDRATASHNTVVVDGLNQRESSARSRAPAPGGRFVFFAADPEFQVAVLDDPNAYPVSTGRYRQTLIVATSGQGQSQGQGQARFALSVFEVHGGLQHDQIFHASAGAPARWQLSVPLSPGLPTLLPPSITFIPTARAEDGRWFVQAFGEFRGLAEARLARPALATLTRPDGPGVRLHVLSDPPLTAYTAESPDPTAGTGNAPGSGRAGLILRRRSEDGSTLKSTFVNIFEPVGTPAPGLLRVGRVASTPETVIVYLETAETAADGGEHVVINLTPGTVQRVTLSDGRALRTDGLVVRVAPRDLTLAGGTFAEIGARQVRQRPASGAIVAVGRGESAVGRGWFLTDQPVPDPDALVGRTLLIRHGDGTTRGWTLTRVENSPDGKGARLHVHEEPGFLIDPANGTARYYQFPRNTAPGPHAYHIARIAHTVTTEPVTTVAPPTTP